MSQALGEMWRYLTDTQVDNAYRAGAGADLLPGDDSATVTTERIRHLRGLGAVVEMAIASYISNGGTPAHRHVTAATCPPNPGGFPITVFCNDGTTWREEATGYGTFEWRQRSPIPQPKSK